MKRVHELFNLLIGTRHDCLQIIVDLGFGHALVRNGAAKVLVAHRNGTVHQVSKRVCQIRVYALAHQLPGDRSVVFIRHLMQYEIAYRIEAENVDHIVHVDHVALGLTHLLAALQQPGMAEHLLGQGLAERHQENRPIDRMETDDVLADQVQVGRPILLVKITVFAVGVIAYAGDIVAQRVKPHVNHVLVVKVHGNAPLERGSGHAKILQTGQQEVVHHLVLSGHGLNEFGMRVDMLDQAVRILLHLEKVSLFLFVMHCAAADGALAVLQLRLGIKGLTLRAVLSFIGALVDVALII